MSSRPPRRMRQSRLDLTPVSSSSPAAAHLSPDVRHRAAIVDHDESPRKRQRTNEGQRPAGINNFGPLTPRSSFPKDMSGVSESSTKAKSGSLIQSDQGDFIETTDSSEDEPLPTSQRRGKSFFNSSTQKSQSKLNQCGLGSKASSVQAAPESSSEDEMPTSAARRRQASSSKDKSMTTQARSKGTSNGSPQPHRHQPRLSRLSRGTKKTPMVISDDEDKSDASPRAKAVESDLGEAESSGDEMLASSPGVKTRDRGRRAVELYSEEESDEIEPTPRRRRRSSRDTTASASEDDGLPIGRLRRIRKKHTASESEGGTTNSHRRKQQEQEDLQEDLEFLGTPAKKARSRKVPPRQKTAREMALERLKRSRAGHDIDSVEEEQPPPCRKRALYDTESESESETVQELDEEEEEEEVDEEDVDRSETRPAIYQASSAAMFQEDDDDQDFLVEDEDETLGVPDEEARLPLQFSSTSRMKAKDLFKFAVEWMVQKKLNPGFSMKDDIYTLTFHKLDDEVHTLAGSKFTSSAWTKDFTRALHARPLMEVTEITATNRALLTAHCGACNRTNHPATFDIRFTGKPYHRETLEELDDDDDDDDDDGEEDNESCNSQGLSIPSADHIFHTGVHCKNNAQRAHALAHWRYHLNEWVVDWLRAEGHLSAEKIVERDNMSTKQRRRYANEVVDNMAERGEIKLLHQHFRAEIDTARNVKTAGWSRYNR